MPTEELKVKISADNADLKRGLGEAGRSVKGFSSELSELATIAGAAFGAREIFEFFKSTVAEAAEAEETAIKLTAALRAQGITSKKVAEDILEFSSAMQQSTRYSDDAVTEAQKLLVSLGQLTGDGLQDATRATLDLASGLGVDLKTAALLVGKAAAGEVSTFSRYGLVVKKTGDRAKDFAAVLDQINAKFGGSAAAQIQGYSGATAQLANTFNEMKESIGGQMLPALEDAAKGIKAIIEAATSDSGFARFTTALLSFGNSEAIRAFNKMKEDGGLLGDDTNLSLATERVNELEAAMGRVAKRKADLEKQRKDSGDPLTNTTGINQAITELDSLTAQWELAVAAREKFVGTNKPATPPVDPAAAESAAKLREEIEKLVATLDAEAFDRFVDAQTRMSEAADAAAMEEFFRLPTEGANALEIELKDTERAYQSLVDLFQSAKSIDALPPDAMEQVEALKQKIIDLRAEIEKKNAAEKKGAEDTRAQDAANREAMAIQQRAASELSGSVADAFNAMAFEGKSANEALQASMKQLTMEAIRFGMQQIVTSAYVGGAKTAEQNAGMGPAGWAVGLAAGAAFIASVLAMKGKLQGFATGGVVTGPSGRDKVPAMLTAGEEVLRADDPRHIRNAGGQRGSVNINMNLMGLPDRSGARRWIRDVLLPELDAVRG